MGFRGEKSATTFAEDVKFRQRSFELELVFLYVIHDERRFGERRDWIRACGVVFSALEIVEIVDDCHFLPRPSPLSSFAMLVLCKLIECTRILPPAFRALQSSFCFPIPIPSF